MSTYGGFSNRHQEMLYGKLNESLVLLMSHHIIQVLNEAPVNLKEFTERLIIIYSQMMKLESSKYYPPRISEYFQDLTLLCASREGVNAPNFDVTTESPSKSDLECPAVDRRSIAVQQAPRVLSDKQINSRSFSQSRFSEKESIVDSPHRTYKGWAQDATPKRFSDNLRTQKLGVKFVRIKKYHSSNLHSSNSRDLYIRSPL